MEFTDDQERQRDDEEARWEAEKPLREARAKEAQRRFDEFRGGLKYETRLVAFLDILGWAAAVERSIDDPELVKDLGVAQQGLSGHRDFVYKTKTMLGLPPGEDDIDFQYAQFSDSVILSTRDSNLAALELYSTLRFQITTLFERKLLVRGAIVSGAAVHRETFAYGPAIVAAYQNEQHVARFPRVILSPDLVERFLTLTRVQDRAGTFLGQFKHWRRDSDGLWFLDFLQPLIADTMNKLPPLMMGNHLRRQRRLIEEGLASTRDNPGKFAKHRWLAEYFNSVRAEYPDAGIEPLDPN